MRLLGNVAVIFAGLVLASSASAEFGVHGALKGGWTDLDVGYDIPASVDIDSTDYTFSILAGMTFPVAGDFLNLGGEIAETYLGEYTAKGPGGDDEVMLYGSELAFVSFFDVATGTKLFVRAGGWAWTMDLDFDYEEDDSGFDPFWGAGFTYGLDNLLFRGEVNRYEADDSRIDAYTIGLQYQFM